MSISATVSSVKSNMACRSSWTNLMSCIPSRLLAMKIATERSGLTASRMRWRVSGSNSAGRPTACWNSDWPSWALALASPASRSTW